MAAPTCHPKLRGLRHDWNKVCSCRTLQTQPRIPVLPSSPLSLAFPSARAHPSRDVTFWLYQFAQLPRARCTSTFASIPLRRAPLLAAHPLLETEQKALGERSCHVHPKDPKPPGQAELQVIVLNHSFNIYFKSRNTVHDHNFKHRFTQAS